MLRYIYVALAILILLTVWGGGVHANNPVPSTLQPRAYIPLILKPAPLSPIEQQVVNLVNQERANVGCPALTINVRLIGAAQKHGSDMAVNNFFSHTGSDGGQVQQRIETTGYLWSAYGENIAAGFSSAHDVMFDPVFGWMNSSGHRSNILNCNFREIGVGYVFDEFDGSNVRLDDGSLSGPFRHYWVQVFATTR